MDAVSQAIKDRICDATGRIPTSRWPLLSTGRRQVIPIAAVTAGAPIEIQADRDYLLTDLSVQVTDSVTGLAVGATVDIEYCNSDYAAHTDVEEWRFCCNRKPVFLLGLKENKRLQITVTLAAAAVNAANVVVAVSGFQGDGCCS